MPFSLDRLNNQRFRPFWAIVDSYRHIHHACSERQAADGHSGAPACVAPAASHDAGVGLAQCTACRPCAAAASTSGSAVYPRVCRRWWRVWNTSTLLHATLSLDLAALEAQAQAQHGPGGLPSLLRLLAQRGQAARRLWLHSEGSQLRMADVLRLVSPPLQSVFLGAGAPPDSCQLLLPRFWGLRSLDLPAAACGTSGGLAGFAQLEELTLREGAPPALLRWANCPAGRH